MLDNLVIFGIAIYHARRQRTPLPVTASDGSQSAHRCFHQHLERTLHRSRRLRRFRLTRGGLLRMGGKLLPVPARLALRAVLPEIENLGAPFRGCDSHALRARAGFLLVLATGIYTWPAV
jgi:hypothetical protein